MVFSEASSFAGFRHSATGFEGFSLALYRRFLIGPSELQFLEKTVLGKFVLQDLERFFDVVVDDLDLQKYPFLSFCIP